MKTTGYFKEYYVGGKYIGRKPCKKEDRPIGYAGKQEHVAKEDIEFKRKKIKKGQKFRTMMYPYN